MRLALNPRVLLRHEFFGGLVHSRDDGSISEISHEDAIFVWAVDLLGDPGLAREVFRRAFPGSSYYPEVKPFLEEDVLKFTDDIIGTINMGEAIAEADRRLMEANSRRHLRAPLALSLYPSMKCNQACGFCFVSQEKKSLPESTLENWRRLLDDAKRMDIPMISVLGGEPTIYPGIEDILGKAEALGLKVNLTTNGTAISDSVMNTMLSSERLTVCFSLQSIDQYHLDRTGIEADKVMRAITAFSEHSRKCRVNTLYSGQTTDQLLDLAMFCINNGVEKLSLSLLNQPSTAAKSQSIGSLREASESLQERLSKIPGSEDLLLTTEGCLLYSAYPEINVNPVETELDNILYGCEAGQTILEVLPNGQALPCILFPADYCPSENIFTQGISRIWDDDPLVTKIRELSCADPACLSCKFGNFCNGGCPSVQLAEYGKMGFIGDPRCELKTQKEAQR